MGAVAATYRPPGSAIAGMVAGTFSRANVPAGRTGRPQLGRSRRSGSRYSCALPTLSKSLNSIGNGKTIVELRSPAMTLSVER